MHLPRTPGSSSPRSSGLRVLGGTLGRAFSATALLSAAALLAGTAVSDAASPPHGLASTKGFVRGSVTAIGDSVMVDYAGDLAVDVPHCTVFAQVGRQWTSGIELIEQLRATGELGGTVVIGLGTNGPIAPVEFSDMMNALSGATRVVFVTVHVDQPWQSEVNTTLVRGSREYHNVIIAPWGSLASANPQWLYADRTHLPIGGPGAQALAALVAKAVAAPRT